MPKNNSQTTIGILGAGKLGIVLAQLARRAGYSVMVAASGPADKIQLTVETLAPGATAHSAATVAARSDIIVLALPLAKFQQIPRTELTGKLVIDAMNYWWEVDGPRVDILSDGQSSSEAIQDFLTESRVVKALSHMGYHHLHDYSRASDDPDRRAIAIAGDRPDDVTIVAQLVDRLGFEPLPIGKLSAGRRLEPGQPAFGANLPIHQLRTLIES